MPFVSLGTVVKACANGDLLGVTDRTSVLDYITRAIELGAAEANWNPSLATLNMCSDSKGRITLPSFVDTVLAVNVCGMPAWGRSNWYEFHINGWGSCSTEPGRSCGWFWDDDLWTPTIQDLEGWSYIAALCEDPIDGNGTLNMIVEGITGDSQGNQKPAITIPASGPSTAGVQLTLLSNYAAVDPQITPFNRIIQVTKPVTRGYVKLLGFKSQQLQNAVTLGYYGPNETSPRYRRIKVGQCCAPCRIRVRMALFPLVDDWQILPLASYQAILDLIKCIRLRETNNMDLAKEYQAVAVDLLSKWEAIQNGPGALELQVDPAFGLGTMDVR